MAYATKEIAENFKTYYGTLYFVNQKEEQVNEKTKNKRFCKNARLPKIPESERQILDKLKTEDEINNVLKESAPWKNPGPDGFTTYLKKIYKEILYMNGLGGGV